MATNIQFLRSATKGLRPDPTRLSLGTPMVNVHPDDPGLYFRLSNDKLSKFGPVHVGPKPPNNSPVGLVGNLEGELWVDTSASEAAWKYWSVDSWKPITSGQNVPIIGNFPPANPDPGDFWYDLSNQVLYMWDGNAWLDVQKKARGTQGSVQINQGGEIEGVSEFTYDTLANTLSVPRVKFNDGTNISSLGSNEEIQYNSNGALSSSDRFKWSETSTTLTAQGNVVIGATYESDTTTSYNDTTFKESVTIEGLLTLKDSLSVAKDLTVGRDTSIGSSHLDTLTVKSTTTFENNVTVGNDRGDTFHSYGVSNLSGNVKIGTAGNSDELIINSEETHIDGNVKLENSATLEQWYLERLSNVEADAAPQGSILKKDGNKWIPADPVSIGSQTQFKGFVDASQPNPGGYNTGDILIQHSASQATVTVDATWPGIGGSTLNEAQYFALSTDGNWYPGGGSVDVEQSDWAETDPNAIEYIKNKPDLQAEVDAKAGDGAIEVNAGDGLIATGQNATANQQGDTTRILAVKVGDGISIDGNGAVIIDPSFNLDGNITAPNDGVLTINDSDGNSVGTFTADQAGNTTVTLPKGFSGSYDDLTEKPVIGDGKLQLTDPTGSIEVVFSANQDSDQAVSVYMKDSYIQNLPTLS